MRVIPVKMSHFPMMQKTLFSLCACKIFKNHEFCNSKIILVSLQYIGKILVQDRYGCMQSEIRCVLEGRPSRISPLPGQQWHSAAPLLFTPTRCCECMNYRELKKKNYWGSIQTETKLCTVWSKSECSNISTSSVMHGLKCWLAALIFWGEIKYLKQKHNKLFNNSVISRSHKDRTYKTVTFTSLCANKNVLNLTWFVTSMVGFFFLTVFSQAGVWGTFVAFYSVLKGLDIWNGSLQYLNFGS